VDPVPAQIPGDEDAVVGEPGRHVAVGVAPSVGEQLHPALARHRQAVRDDLAGDGEAKPGNGQLPLLHAGDTTLRHGVLGGIVRLQPGAQRRQVLIEFRLVVAEVGGSVGYHQLHGALGADDGDVGELLVPRCGRCASAC
jgi:hypothetical protein